MFEEVKEMIDSTIYTNGRGEVTAQNVNLAMHGMVDATEEKFGEVNDAVKTVEDKVTALEENGTGGGSGALRVWMTEEGLGELTPEQIAENVNTYNTLMSGEHVSVILCSNFEESSEEFSISQTSAIPVSYVALKYGTVDETNEGIHLYLGEDYDNAITLNPDGTVTLPETPEESFGTRDFYVPMLGVTLTEQQKSDNASTANRMKDADFRQYQIVVWKVGAEGVVANETGGFGYTRRYSDTCSFLVYIDNVLMHVQIKEDTGETTVVSMVESSPASNGPLRVWINELGGGENDSEMLAENAATFKAMWNGKPQLAIFSAKLELGGMPLMVAKPTDAYRLISEDGVNMISLTYSDIVYEENGLELMEIFVYLKEDGTVIVEQ